MTQSSKILNSAARAVSIILHPLFMSVYGISLLFVYTDFKYVFYGQFYRFLLPVFIFTLLIPANILFIMKRAGIIKDYDIRNRNDRLLPYMAILACYIMLFIYFYQSGLFIWFLALILAPSVLLIVASIITNWWKISAHMAGIGGLTGGVMSVCYFVKGSNPYVLFAILFILAGCLGTARLILKRHTPAQVYYGFLLGLIITVLCVCIGANFAYIYLYFKLS